MTRRLSFTLLATHLATLLAACGAAAPSMVVAPVTSTLLHSSFQSSSPWNVASRSRRAASSPTIRRGACMGPWSHTTWPSVPLATVPSRPSSSVVFIRLGAAHSQVTSPVSPSCTSRARPRPCSATIARLASRPPVAVIAASRISAARRCAGRTLSPPAAGDEACAEARPED